MTQSQFSLDDIRRHPKFPFDAWKQDDTCFLMLELYWAELVRKILGDEMASYAPLFDTERDGNPILTLTNASARRGLRLIMIENADGKVLYPEKTGPDAFYSLYPFANNGFMPDGETLVEELGMFLTLDERYSEYFEYLVKLHCCDYASMAQMEEAIAAYEDKFDMRGPAAELSDD